MRFAISLLRFKSRIIDTLQDAILLSKLRAFVEYEIDARNQFAAMYTEGLKDVWSKHQ